MTKNNVLAVAIEQPPEEQLYEAVKELPENMKLILVGVARGLELSSSITV